MTVMATAPAADRTDPENAQAELDADYTPGIEAPPGGLGRSGPGDRDGEICVMRMELALENGRPVGEITSEVTIWKP